MSNRIYRYLIINGFQMLVRFHDEDELGRFMGHVWAEEPRPMLVYTGNRKAWVRPASVDAVILPHGE